MKTAALKEEVQLQPHQARIQEEAQEHPIRKLLYWTVGSGKSLGALSAAEAAKEPFTVVAPASLRPNYRKEIERFSDKSTPADVLSYSAVAKGHPVQNLYTLIGDEAQRLTNPATKQTQQMLDLANRAKQLVLLSGTPIVNHPSELAPLMSMLTNKPVAKDDFTRRYVGTKDVSPGLIGRLMGVRPGVEPAVNHEDELRELLKGHVDYYQPAKPLVPVTHEDIPVEMSVPQSRLYRAIWNELPWMLRWKLKHDFPMTKEELSRMQSFLSGPRQVGLSTLPFQRNKDPLRAFDQSTKLQTAYGKLQDKLKDERAKAIVYSNFIDAGLVPYAAALEKAKIPHGVFHGGLSDAERKRLVEDFNNNRLRVALLGPSGAEGLSFKGAQLLQLLDSHWNAARNRQAEGRGIRFDSHTDLPEDLRNMTVQRYISRLPLGLKDRLLSRFGFSREKQRYASDDYLRQMAERKDRLNTIFLDLLKDVGTPEKKGSDNALALFRDLESDPGYISGSRPPGGLHQGPQSKAAWSLGEYPVIQYDPGNDRSSCLVRLGRTILGRDVLVRDVTGIHELGDTKEASVIASLRQAKEHSDRRNWSAKLGILVPMIKQNPKAWRVDSEGGHVVGITHKSTGWRFHMPRTALPEGVGR